MILTKINDKYISYVGYAKSLKDRLSLHNRSKGAKFTKGKKWILIYSKKYPSKITALKEEFKLKKDKKKRKLIKKKFIEINENINSTSV
ncbi:GIY-YIG nuclease family protein [Candidatus Pelagibacter sp.]|nr:GIY-YIG nuclease family protein [Candidatus Pelagibacter sp.]